MGGRGQASRSSGNSRGGQSLNYSNAVMPQLRTKVGDQLIRSNSDLGRDIMNSFGGSGVPVYTRNNGGRLMINRSEQSRRRTNEREAMADRARQTRRERSEREAWNTAFANMFRR